MELFNTHKHTTKEEDLRKFKLFPQQNNVVVTSSHKSMKKTYINPNSNIPHTTRFNLFYNHTRTLLQLNLLYTFYCTTPAIILILIFEYMSV
jgi:hypothetical protein